MFESAAGLFTDKKYTQRSGELGEREARYWVEEWLRGRCRSEALYCERVSSGVVSVRVEAGWVRQEIVLWQSDLLAALKKDLSMECEYVQFVY